MDFYHPLQKGVVLHADATVGPVVDGQVLVTLEQKINGKVQEYRETLVSLEDQAVREALQKLGWRPPEVWEPVTPQVVERLAKEHIDAGDTRYWMFGLGFVVPRIGFYIPAAYCWPDRLPCFQSVTGQYIDAGEVTHIMPCVAPNPPQEPQ